MLPCSPPSLAAVVPFCTMNDVLPWQIFNQRNIYRAATQVTFSSSIAKGPIFVTFHETNSHFSCSGFKCQIVKESTSFPGACEPATYLMRQAVTELEKGECPTRKSLASTVPRHTSCVLHCRWTSTHTACSRRRRRQRPARNPGAPELRNRD